jgi:hypothetical protein
MGLEPTTPSWELMVVAAPLDAHARRVHSAVGRRTHGE